MELRTIGVVHTTYTEHRSTPQQASLNAEESAWVEVDDDLADGLEALEEFDYVWLITWLGDDAVRSEGPLSEVPDLVAHLDLSVGSFATRGPFRPTPLGLHLVELVSVVGSRVTFRGVDMVEGTVVVDIKPYVKEFDRPDQDTRSGWYAKAALAEVAKQRGILA